MTGHLTDADRARAARAGIVELPTQEGLELLDVAWTSPKPTLAPVRLDLAAARTAGRIPSLLRELVPTTLPTPAPTGTAAQTDTVPAPADGLTKLSGPERHHRLVTLVRREAATALGLTDIGPVHPTQAFRSLGFDSLTAVELRNRLKRALGVGLSATAVFDHPTPDALATRLAELMFPDAQDAPDTEGAVHAGDEPGIRAALAEVPLSRLNEAGLLGPLLALLDLPEHKAEGADAGQGTLADDEGPALDDLDAESLVRLALSVPDDDEARL